MKTSLSLVTVFGLVALVGAAKRWDNGTVWITEIVTAYTTYCPSPTLVVQNNQTYTVTSATLLTITNCPCTILSMAPIGSSVTTLPTAGPAPTTTAAGGGGGGGGATASGTPGATTSGFSQSSNANAMAGSCFGAIIALGIMASLF